MDMAIKWWEKSVELGNADDKEMLCACCALLSTDYYKGEGGKSKNYQKAFYWVSKCANLGDLGGMHLLGCMYYVGEGTPKNRELAEKWLRKSANLGYKDAANSLKEWGFR